MRSQRPARPTGGGDADARQRRGVERGVAKLSTPAVLSLRCPPNWLSNGRCGFEVTTHSVPERSRFHFGDAQTFQIVQSGEVPKGRARGVQDTAQQATSESDR